MYLATHMSTSRDRRVAESFADWDEGGGLLLEIHIKSFSQSNEDVTWISKFPNEKETLLTGNNKFYVTSVTEEASDYGDSRNQHVVLESEVTYRERRGELPNSLEEFEKRMAENVQQGMWSPEDLRGVLEVMRQAEIK